MGSTRTFGARIVLEVDNIWENGLTWAIRHTPRTPADDTNWQSFKELLDEGDKALEEMKALSGNKIRWRISVDALYAPYQRKGRIKTIEVESNLGSLASLLKFFHPYLVEQVSINAD